MFVVSLYANLFESNETLQSKLVTPALVASFQRCLDLRTTLIQMLQNITDLQANNTVFDSPFFAAFLEQTPTDLADEECSASLEFLRTLVSYTHYQKALLPALAVFEGILHSALAVVSDAAFPKNIADDQVSQVCLSVKTVLDFYDDFYNYTALHAAYERVLEPLFDYAAHGALCDPAFSPAPTQSHAWQILCHIATIDAYLPFFFRSLELIERVTFETSGNTRMMEIQRHAIGIMQSFSTNEAYVAAMVERGVLQRMAPFFTEEGVMNQPLVYRCLCILQNATTLYPRKEVFLQDEPLAMITATFAHVSNLVIRYAAVHALKNILHENPTTFDVLKAKGGVDCFIDVCMGKDELQVDEEKVERRVRYEATRIMAHVVAARADALEVLGRAEDVLACLQFLIESEFVVLIKEGLEAIVALHTRGQIADAAYLPKCKEIVERQKGVILQTDEMNIKMNEELLQQMDTFLAL